MKAWLPSGRPVPRDRPVDAGMLLRAAALVFVVVALTVAAMQSSRVDGRDDVNATAGAIVDPLSADLDRCRTVTPEQLAADDRCRRIWEENRRRFFAPAASRQTVSPADPVAAAPFKNQDRIAPAGFSPAQPEAR